MIENQQLLQKQYFARIDQKIRRSEWLTKATGPTTNDERPAAGVLSRALQSRTIPRTQLRAGLVRTLAELQQ